MFAVDRYLRRIGGKICTYSIVVGCASTSSGRTTGLSKIGAADGASNSTAVSADQWSSLLLQHFALVDTTSR
jgi:hypothetical protein